MTSPIRDRVTDKECNAGESLCHVDLQLPRANQNGQGADSQRRPPTGESGLMGRLECVNDKAELPLGYGEA